MPELKDMKESALKQLTFKQLKSTLIDNYKDFFDVMFFGTFEYDADKKYIEDQKAILGDELKNQLKIFATDTKNILKSPNQGIEDAIYRDSQKEGTKANIHTLPDYENKKKLYEIIAYTYDKEVTEKLPVDKWRGNIVFTTIPQSVRLNGRVNQINSINALSTVITEDALLFDVSRKEGGFQQVNYTVKPCIGKGYDPLTAEQKKLLQKLSGGNIEILETEMYGKSKEQRNKDYERSIPPETKPESVVEGKKIHFCDGTAQKLREHIFKEKSISKNEILVADAGNAYSPGGDPLGGGGGQEESLIQSDPKLYVNLLQAVSDFYQDYTEYDAKKQEKYNLLARNAIAAINIYNRAKKHTGSDKLLLAIKGEIKEPLEKDNEISSFMSSLLKNKSFKNKSLLLKEIEKEAETINEKDKKVIKLAEDMLHRKSKNKIIMINPEKDDLKEPVLEQPEIENSNSADESPKKLKSGYVVFNAPDLREINQYISSKVSKKLAALVKTEKEKLVGKSEEEIDRIVEELIEKETPAIEEQMQEKINQRVFNSIKYQVVEACKAAKGKYKYLIFGAIGGGIFKCPNKSVAKAFYEVLVNQKYKEEFDGVYFAIYRNEKAMNDYKTVFSNVLGEEFKI